MNEPTAVSSLGDAITGCLLGTAVGDAIGLPMEGLTKQRQRRMYPRLDGHCFVLGRGMISDDTEHTCMVAQALLHSAGDESLFASSLASQLRTWLLGVPAGVGLATLKACLRLLMGFSPERSGVFSAGNGPAMRSSIIGVCWGHDLDTMRRLVRASTRITHTDRKAEHGALAVALAAHMSSGSSSEDGVEGGRYLQELGSLLGESSEELLSLVARAVESAGRGEATEVFTEQLGLGRGITGYVYHTVPIVLHSWLRDGRDFRNAVLSIIRCGGDTDTTAAILGGIIGAGTGKAGIPREWLDGLWAWPRNMAWMERLASRLDGVCSDGCPGEYVSVSAPALYLRNLLFLTLVLSHGFRRLAPPY